MFSVLLPVEGKLHELENHVWLVVPTTLVTRTMLGTKQTLNNLNELFAPHILLLAISLKEIFFKDIFNDILAVLWCI